MPRALPANMRASRRWLTLACAYVLWSVPAISFAQSQAQTPSPQTALSPDQEEEEEIEELEEEVGDRDPTYLRTRTVVRYDHRLLGPASIDRFRLRLLYGFGPKQRYAVSALEPIGMLHRGVPIGDVLRWALMGNEERITAETALRLGLVTEVVPREELWDRAHGLAAEIAARRPEAVQGTVRAIWEALEMTRTIALQNGLSYTHIGNPAPNERPARGPKQTPRLR